MEIHLSIGMNTPPRQRIPRTNDPGVSPPRLIIAPSSVMPMQELKQSLRPGTGRLWLETQQQVQNSQSTNHFQALYSPRQWRSLAFALLFLICSALAVIYGHDLQGDQSDDSFFSDDGISLRSILSLSVIVFGLSAALTVVLAWLSVGFILSFAALIVLGIVAGTYWLVSRTAFFGGDEDSPLTLLSATPVAIVAALGYVIITLLQIALSKSMRMLNLGSLMLRKNPMLFVGAFVSETIMWTIVYFISPVLVTFGLPTTGVSTGTLLWYILYLYWLKELVGSVLSFMASGIAVRCLYEPLAPYNWHAWNQLKNLPRCFGSLVRVSLFVGAVLFLRHVGTAAQVLASKTESLLNDNRYSPLTGLTRPFWWPAKIALSPVIMILRFVSGTMLWVVSKTLEFFGSQVIVNIGVFGGSVEAAASRTMATTTTAALFDSGMLYVALWVSRIIVVSITITILACLDSFGLMDLVMGTSSVSVWFIACAMAFITASDMSALLAATSEALMLAMRVDPTYLRRKYQLDELLASLRRTADEDVDTTVPAILFERLYDIMARHNDESHLLIEDDDKEERNFDTKAWERSEEEYAEQLLLMSTSPRKLTRTVFQR